MLIKKQDQGYNIQDFKGVVKQSLLNRKTNWELIKSVEKNCVKICDPKFNDAQSVRIFSWLCDVLKALNNKIVLNKNVEFFVKTI